MLVRVASGQQRHTIGGGTHHSLVVKDGELFSSGWGLFGQLGHGNRTNQSQPKRVVALAKERAVSVAAGKNHSLALTAEGALFSFGLGAYGRLGHGDTENPPQPKLVAALAKERVVSVAAGMSHSLALTAEGALLSFGYGAYGRLGHGDTANLTQPKRVVALAKERIVGVAAGDDHSLALTAEGALFSFGWCLFGQLGHGDTAGQLQPKAYRGTGTRAIAHMVATRLSPGLRGRLLLGGWLLRGWVAGSSIEVFSNRPYGIVGGIWRCGAGFASEKRGLCDCLQTRAISCGRIALPLTTMPVPPRQGNPHTDGRATRRGQGKLAEAFHYRGREGLN